MQHISSPLMQSDLPVPKHIAIIMDGNGRWAQTRGLPRSKGHRKGVEALRQTVRNVGEMGIRVLTVYAFSSENWSRPRNEVQDLLGLLKLFIRRDLAELHRDGVRVRIIGRRDSLPDDIAPLLEEAEVLTRENSAMELVIAFNYGGQDEIVRATQLIAKRVQEGLLEPDEIDNALVNAALDTRGIPHPELIIRTSGEKRLSNFLLWQAAYSEFVFVDCNWPDFDNDQLTKAIVEYQNRDRRFGAIADGQAEVAG